MVHIPTLNLSYKCVNIECSVVIFKCYIKFIFNKCFFCLVYIENTISKQFFAWKHVGSKCFIIGKNDESVGGNLMRFSFAQEKTPIHASYVKRSRQYLNCHLRSMDAQNWFNKYRSTKKKSSLCFSWKRKVL